MGGIGASLEDSKDNRHSVGVRPLSVEEGTEHGRTAGISEPAWGTAVRTLMG